MLFIHSLASVKPEANIRSIPIGSREGVISRPGQIWTSDMSYNSLLYGFIYLVVVMGVGGVWVYNFLGNFNHSGEGVLFRGIEKGSYGHSG